MGQGKEDDLKELRSRQNSQRWHRAESCSNYPTEKELFENGAYEAAEPGKY